MFESLKNDYQVSEEIGRGRFGAVFRCTSTASAHSFACKSIDKRHLSDPVDRQCLDREPKILHLLSGHPNILRLHAVFDDPNFLHIVTDLCDSDDLYARLTAARSFSEPAAFALFQPLISALAHCHRVGVAHRDIKPDNILFDSGGKLKLADFGSAEWFFCAGERRPMRGIVGTPYYVAPEVLAGRDYSEKVDVWSAGVILYILLAGVPPFYGETPVETFEAVMRGNLRFPTKIFRSVSPEAKDLLRKMICKDVSRRLSAEQVLRHPWMINGGETGSTADLT
ncbi:phosphoenolpyruvate carboxylase kinase 1 [Diospyros lotus]|uniref:phosphoenolpyruvate carboxylase kinase 1 n=1 Tax=Diospyros lotus TaxID=55363 RepID=UPI00224DB766|nr:phosphoenolpyruvate carboxylase kinase 1 [Diospyros lotus]